MTLLAIGRTAIVAFFVVLLLCAFPRHEDPQTPIERLNVRSRLSPDSSTLLSVLSFNIRLDTEEPNPDNHFTRRVHRLAAFLNDTAPWVVGMQEPFSGQLLHLQSMLPERYTAIGYGGLGHSKLDRADPRRHSDFQTAILFDSGRLQLVLDDHVWLSRSPRTPNSKDWDSMGSRTVTIAAFRIRSQIGDSADKMIQHCNDYAHEFMAPVTCTCGSGMRKLRVNVGSDSEGWNCTAGEDVHVIVFNTHLDVISERARREQSMLLRRHVEEWQARFPLAAVFVTGDFNSANGQPPHRILLDSSAATSGQQPMTAAVAASPGAPLLDAWDVCAADINCMSVPFGATFHGWLGASVNTYAARLIIYSLLAIHGSGVALPTSVPTSMRGAVRALKDVWARSELHPRRVWDALPSSLSRLHVDWVLFAPGHDGGVALVPVLVLVAEVRSAEYSSDHFPVVSFFEVRSSMSD